MIRQTAALLHRLADQAAGGTVWAKIFTPLGQAPGWALNDFAAG
jgi:hypothetical protein